MKWFYLNIKPSDEIGGVRYFGVIRAESVPDAIKRFQPRLDTVNSLIKRRVKGLTQDPFELQSVSFTDYENVNQQWAIDVANSILRALEEDE
jgi:hypothetical protein